VLQIALGDCYEGATYGQPAISCQIQAHCQHAASTLSVYESVRSTNRVLRTDRPKLRTNSRNATPAQKARKKKKSPSPVRLCFNDQGKICSPTDRAIQAAKQDQQREKFVSSGFYRFGLPGACRRKTRAGQIFPPRRVFGTADPWFPGIRIVLEGRISVPGGIRRRWRLALTAANRRPLAGLSAAGPGEAVGS
jgi:hypothetical protein